MRASTSACPSGESLGMSAACGGTLLVGSERRPPKSAAATFARSFDDAAGAAIAPGATAATAEARAARRANSRREMPPGLAELSLGVSSIRSPFVSYGEVRNRLRLVPRRLLKVESSVNISEEMVEAKKQGARWVVAQMERVSEVDPRVDRKSKCNGMNGVKEEMEETLPANPANDVAQRPGLREAADSRAIGPASLALEQSSTPPH